MKPATSRDPTKAYPSLTPARMPNAVPIAASSSDSARIMRLIYFRVLPTARNVPIFRVRSNKLITCVFTSAISEGIECPRISQLHLLTSFYSCDNISYLSEFIHS
ncbi:MAG: hypothetical protein A2030_08330 [Chloroflexi bacterium RBG_19FT_COMBO_50_10]|nr:MAG: hypothetical protein A2030_08330 [Chloroflexi bacterium RBG_19FT_COMBO_50_10]